jgi:hypothetical protein
MRGIAVLLLVLLLPRFGSGQEGAKTAPLAPDTPQCDHGCCFTPSIKVGGETLSLRGVSGFRYWGFRVYTAALYAPLAAQTRDAVRGETRKKLVLCYHRSLSPEQFQEKSQEVLEDTPGLDLTTLEPHLSAINNAYVGVTEGDRYSITYQPSSGTMNLFFNEREPGLVSIQSRAFAKAYFGIWLSEYSVGKQFTAELFGEKETE